VEITLDIPGTPPSLNAASLGSRGAHMKFNRLKKQWEGDILKCLMLEKAPRRCERVHATAVCRFPSKRKRDEGNFRYLLEKALGDALQLYGTLPDDTADEFTFGKLEFDPEKGQARTLITLVIECSTETA
jgi:hypothetical protein